MVGASCFPNIFFQTSVQFFLLQFIFKNSVTILREPYFLNWYKFVDSALSSWRNGMLDYQHIVTALKIIIYNDIVLLFTKIGNVSKSKRNLT